MAGDADDGGIDRRSVLRTIGTGAVGTAGALGASGSAAADQSPDHFHNPTGPRNIGDPSVVRARDGTFYVYGTNTPLARSEDLVNWTWLGEVLQPEDVDWRSNSDAGLWAPDVNYYDGQYYLYYSYSTWGSQNNPGIGVATADHPEGPFTDQGVVFRAEDLGMTNAIDSELVIVDGTPYMVWGSWYGIYGVELTPDAMDYVPGTSFHIAGDHREGAMIVQENGYYYCFYSTGVCCDGYDSTYAVEVGRSENFFGPYYNRNGDDLRDLNEHHSGQIVLSDDGSDRFTAPGHNTAIQDDAGDWWMLYHVEATTEREGRVLMVDRIRWDDQDWPVVGCDGTPCEQSPRPQIGDVATETPTVTETSTSEPCEPTPIEPHLRVAGGEWRNTSGATVEPGTEVRLGPHPTDGGSWEWLGPGLDADTREVVVTPQATSTYTARYTNDCGAVSSFEFAVTVGDTGDEPGPVGDDENAPTDPDDDGRYEDVNGDGATNLADAGDLFQHRDSPAVTDHVDAYDFSGNGEVDLADVVDLFQENAN